MNGTDQHVSVNSTLGFDIIVLFCCSFGDFTLERGDNILNISGRDNVHGNFQNFFANVWIGRRKGPKDIHEQFLQNLAVFTLQVLQSFQDNHLDVVVL